MQHWELVLFFFVIAFVYASVGFGGGSSYLAVLSFYAFPFQEMRVIALLCNIIVVLDGSIIYLRNRQVNMKKILPLVLVSIPAAYMGATVRISQQTFFIVLGISLLAAAILLWMKTPQKDQEAAPPQPLKDSAIGGAIGFLSGMVGIGGGIFLSPVLHLMKWDTARKIAATASVFILFNSIAGIAGQFTNMTTTIDMSRVWMLGAAVFTGGMLGSNMGAVKFDQQTIRRVTAILVFVAGANVLLKHL